MSNKNEKVIMKLKDEGFIHQLVDLLVKTGRVKVTNLGIFEIRTISARKGFNPFTKKPITIPEHKKIAFKPLKNFKDKING